MNIDENDQPSISMMNDDNGKSQKNDAELDLFYARTANENESDVEDSEDDCDDNENIPNDVNDQKINGQEINENQNENNVQQINFDELLKQLNDKYQQMTIELSAKIDKKNITKGKWIKNKQLVEIIGKDYLKHYQPKHRHLKPFEALFLQECRTLAIYYENLLLSIEDSYELLLRNENDVKLYKIFSTLSRIGFYVDHNETKESDQKELSSHGVKRTASEEDGGDQQEMESKKLNTSTNETNSADNNKNKYPVITGITPLKLENISKLNKMDRELIKHYSESNNDDNNQTSTNPDQKISASMNIIESPNPASNHMNDYKSYLYCVKAASRPSKNVSPLFKSLYDDTNKLKPLIPLGATYDTNGLFELIQRNSPLTYEKQTKSILNIDFNVYHSQMDKKQNKNSKPLFSVIVIDEQQHHKIPSIDDIKYLNDNHIRKNNVPILFAIMAEFTYNFYSFENLIIENKYPRLWETHNHY